ncbi:TPA: DUF551 domain-containing protein [Enterobacter roggenkampii]
MSTITKELAKLFRKITNSEIDAEGNAHVVLSPADSLLINNARIALASLEAEPYGYVHKAAYEQAGSCGLSGDHEAYRDSSTHIAVYTAPPAPISVPAAMEMDDDFDSSFEHGKAVGWNAYRAAMLQSFGNSEQLNSPVIPDGWVACSERMPETMVSVLVTGTWFHHSVAFWDGLSWCDLDFEQPVTHWMPLPAAPQQEVNNG